MIDITKLVSGGLLKLYNSVDNTTASPVIELYPVSALKYQVNNTPANDVLLTECVVTLSANKVDPATFELLCERFYLLGGTIVTKPDGTEVVQFAGANIRGLGDIHKLNPPTAAESFDVNYMEHLPEAIAVVPVDWLIRYLQNTWEATSQTGTGEMGEASAIHQVVSLHTDGKLYKYNKATYPDVQGMLMAAYGIGDTAIFTNLRGLHTGMSGLTQNEYIYAEDGVAYTQTPSATTTLIGKSKGTTAAFLAFSVPSVAAASQAQMEAGVVQGVYGDPKGVKQAIDYQVPTVELAGWGSSIDIIGTEIFGDTSTSNTQSSGTGSGFSNSASGILLKSGTVNTGFAGIIKQPAGTACANVKISLGLSVSAAGAANSVSFFGTGGQPALNSGDYLTSIVSCIGFVIKNVAGTLTLYAKNGDGSATTTTDLGTYSSEALRIVKTASSVKFYKNNVLVATHTTNVPATLNSSGGLFVCQVWNGNSSTTSMEIYVNMFSYYYKY